MTHAGQGAPGTRAGRGDAAEDAEERDPDERPREVDPNVDAPAPASRLRAILKLAALAALFVGGVLTAHLTPVGDYLSRDGIFRAIDLLRASAFAPVIFVIVYATATALAIPGTILTLAGGALFGVVWGSIYNTIAANIGANAAFLIARWLGRDGVRRLTGDRLERLDRATREHGFRGLLLLRLVPLVPFNALNFGAGLTAMSWRTYASATAIGILPGTIVYTMFADALLAGSREASREALVRVLLSGALLILLAFLPQILKKMKIDLPGTTALLAALLLPLGTPGHSRAQEPALPDPAPFTAVLEAVVEGDRVDYAALQEDRQGLDAFLATLAATPPEALGAADRDARLAFWINAYNACMLRLVVDHYPLTDAGGFFHRLKNKITGRPANSVWQIEDVFTRGHCEVAGEARSQDEIEHEIIRPMGEPRIHFAVNCAARSCPPLAREAYRGGALDGQLDRQVRRFVADPDHFRLETADPPVLTVNKVLDWFGEDFGGPAGVADFFAAYVEGARRDALLSDDVEVDFFEYDWTLNDVER